MENKLYKIVKSYPFSPPVGTILHYDSFADWYQNPNEDYVVESRIVEKYPEYFEEVKDECRFLVFTINRPFYNSFEVIEFKKPINTESYAAEKNFVRFFKTKADAYDFIIDNKPCLSLDDLFQINHGNNDVLCMKYDKLKRLVQERL
jgi:hypothetical protein